MCSSVRVIDAFSSLQANDLSETNYCLCRYFGTLSSQDRQTGSNRGALSTPSAIVVVAASPPSVQHLPTVTSEE